jgi:signal transduction histidine kinase/CheY-like chemotaxis protein
LAVYGLTLLAVAVTVLLRHLLNPWLGDVLPLASVFWAVIFAVWLGGWRPALVATVAGYAVCSYLFIQPRYTFSAGIAGQRFGVIAYFPTCAAVIWFGEAMWRARRRAEAATAAAEGQAASLRESQAQLRRAVEDARQANEAKDRFLAALSHELRTPLTPVLLSVGGMEADPGLPAPVRAELAMIRRSIALETRLIDDLLDISRMVTGKLVLQVGPVAAHPVLRDVAEMLAGEFREKAVTLRCDLAAADDVLAADATRLQQVAWNLLKNAAKFTPAGGTAAIRTGNPRPGLLRVEVTDTGIGIDATTLPTLFAAFQQGGPAITQEFGGLGLGLAICKALVEMHGGTLTAASEGRGKGACFTIDLPTAPAAARLPAGVSPRASAPAVPQSLRLLLVEDNDVTLRTLRRLLEGTGHRVAAAGTVAAALQAARDGAFDLLLSDIGLPDGSGLDLLKGLRDAGHRMPAIALTGFGMHADIERSKAAGFAAHLTKPVDLQELEAAILRIGGAARV